MQHVYEMVDGVVRVYAGEGRMLPHPSALSLKSVSSVKFLFSL
jgi:hypothetical protein